MKQTTADRLYLLLVDRLRVIGGTRHAAEDIAAEIDALTAERDEARAHNAELSTELAGANFEGNLAMIQRDEARAEAERLRPLAEAFGWWENYASNANTTTWDIFQTAAQRAREARK